MDKGLGELGFWLAVGMVVAAMIVAGAIKERDKERERQAALRTQPNNRQETLRALLENGGENMPEVLAYLRERDAAGAARTEAAMRRMEISKRQNDRQGLAVVAAFMVGTFSFIGGLAVAETLHRPALPRLVFSPEAGRLVPAAPPPPTGLEAWLPVGLMLGIWAVGLVVALLIAIWGGIGRPNHDAQPGA